MAGILHACALATAAIGAACLAADRGRGRGLEVVASIVMLLAMLDAAAGGEVPAVFSAAMLVAGALALVAIRRAAPQRVSPPARNGVTAHTALGMIVMAALALGMTHPDAAAPAHAHGTSSGVLVFATLAGAAAYAAAATIAVVSARGVLARLHHAGMAASTVAMSLALLA